MKAALVSPSCKAARPPIILYGFGHLSRSLIWCVADMLIAYHLAVRLGLSGATTGIVLTGSFVIGAGLNLVVAALLERRARLKSDVFRFQAIAAWGTVVGALLLFWPVHKGRTPVVAFIFVSSVLFRTSYAVLDISLNALTSLLPRSDAETRRFVVIRSMVGAVGRLCAALVVSWAVRTRWDDHADVLAIALIASPVLLSGVLLRLSRAPPNGVPPIKAVRFRWSRLPWRGLCPPVIAIIATVGLLGFIGRLVPFFERIAHGGVSGSELIVAMVVGMIAGPLLGGSNARQERRGAGTAAGLVGAAVLMGAALLTRLAPAQALGAAFAYGAALAAITNLAWNRTAMVVRRHAADTGMRADAFAFAFLSASINVAIAISNALLAFLLDGFRARSPRSLAEITAVVLVGGAAAWAALVTGRPDDSLTGGSSRSGLGLAERMKGYADDV